MVGRMESLRDKAHRVGNHGVTADRIRGRRVRVPGQNDPQPVLKHEGCLRVAEAVWEQLIHLLWQLPGWHGGSGRREGPTDRPMTDGWTEVD